MDVTFTERPDGQVDASLGPAFPLFNEALSDAISSLPPRGASGNGPSTYWIDVAAAGARAADASASEQPFTGGNITELSVRGGHVVARFDYDDPAQDGESIALGDFLTLLEAWRERVEASARHCTVPLPETYRRNGLR